ncbi:MAG: hypothetical protein GVY36_02725 [Verrucomicrobia bacterium]|jgi:hypothetical protein|nr:hypothetical protein [Verrucomicrobiota bacterium]
MKIKVVTLIQFLIVSLLSSQTVNVKIVNEDGVPLSDAEVNVSFSDSRYKEGYEGKVQQSDENGKASFSGMGRLGILLWVKKEGYYPYGDYPAERERLMAEEGETVYREVVLRTIRNPIRLYAKRTFVGDSLRRYTIPEMDKWLGFDFEAGDWVEPHGSGKEADILVRYYAEFVKFRNSPSRTMEERRASYRRKCERQGISFTEEGFKKAIGLWEGTLEFSFPGEKEGLVRVEDDFLLHNALRMPHEAPEHGYMSEYVVEKAEGPVPGGVVTDETPKKYLDSRKDIGFFLRTRVKLDENGEILSANYSKVHGDFQFGPKGYFAFDYYFNPTPNDRNLEFDPKRNLFPKSVEGSNVIFP